jgi:hypothetical protein
MSDPTPPVSPLSQRNDPTELTIASVRWDALSAIACLLFGTTSATWGEQHCGGYNIVRFLHLVNDNETTVVVARIPLRPDCGWESPESVSIARRITSEVATMKYIECHTRIQIPHVLQYSAEADGGGEVGSPYILMTKVDGVRLSDVWDDMDDHSRKSILRQVVDILLELSSHRFDKIGYLFHQSIEETGKGAWGIEPLEIEEDSSLSCRVYNSGTDFAIHMGNVALQEMRETFFGYRGHNYHYAWAWSMRSLVPALYDNSLDTTGFPLLHGDFHSQNILICDVDSGPHITGVIDWEFSGTKPTSSFAQYPLFIVDHPAWGPDHPLRPRNVCDQKTFLELMREAETKLDMGPSLSRAFQSCIRLYQFEQSVDDPLVASELYRPLFSHFYGDDPDFFTEFHNMLREHVLKKETDQFAKEEALFDSAKEILLEELAGLAVTRVEFQSVVHKFIHRFEEGHPVRQWLTDNEIQDRL